MGLPLHVRAASRERPRPRHTLAGAAALVAEANPSFTPAQIQSFLEGRAVDLGTAGKDNLYGSGKLLARHASSTRLVFDVTGSPTRPAPPTSPSPRPACSTAGSATACRAPFSAGVPRTFQVSGLGGVPANAVAVTGNLTVTQQSALGFVYLGPAPVASPTSSTLNFPLADNRANGVTVALGAGGSLSATYVRAAGATTDLVFDVTGYFVPDATGATFVPLTPARLLDTRVGNGLTGTFAVGVPRTFQVSGRGGVPANAVAVTGNLTVTNQTKAGYVFLGPDPTASPTSSTLNFPLADNRANGVTVALGAGGSLSATYVAAPAPRPT